MKLPDGFIFRILSVKKGTAIRVEGTEDLICCRSCKHAFNVRGPRGTELCCSFWEEKGDACHRVTVDPEDFCSNAKGDE